VGDVCGVGCDGEYSTVRQSDLSGYGMPCIQENSIERGGGVGCCWCGRLFSLIQPGSSLVR